MIRKATTLRVLDAGMKSRITLSMTPEGTLELFLNEAGRDEMMAWLKGLSKEADHFHLMPEDYGMDVSLSETPYRKTDKIVSFAKVMFRPDDWDEKHYPHVLG